MTPERKNVGQAMSRPRNPERVPQLPLVTGTESVPGRRPVGPAPIFDATKREFVAPDTKRMGSPGMLGNPWVQKWTQGRDEERSKPTHAAGPAHFAKDEDLSPKKKKSPSMKGAAKSKVSKSKKRRS